MSKWYISCVLTSFADSLVRSYGLFSLGRDVFFNENESDQKNQSTSKTEQMIIYGQLNGYLLLCYRITRVIVENQLNIRCAWQLK